MTKRLFITATDTDAGKTYVACALTEALVKAGKRVAVFKPIAAGGEQNIDGQWVNEDARQLQLRANCAQSITEVNPIFYPQPIAPHIAATLNDRPISDAELQQSYRHNLALNADFLLCEGAGGWRLPLGNGRFLSDFARDTEQQVVLVVNMKLGCLNHAVLTYQAIVADGLTCVGWVANCQSEMPYLAENLAELTSFLPMPLLATLSWQPDISTAAANIDIAPLLV